MPAYQYTIKPIYPEILSSFETISHPDRLLKTHLDHCNQLSETLLENKQFSGSFFTFEQLNYWRKVLAYLHDMGKATNYFQYKIGTVALEKKELPDELYQSVESFIHDHGNALVKEIRENDKLANHARFGALFAYDLLKEEELLVRFIMSNIILAHHGNLPDFNADGEGRSKFLLDESGLAAFEKQIVHFRWESFNQIAGALNQPLSANAQKELTELFTKQSKLNRLIDKPLSQQKDAKLFLLQHLLFSLVLSADKGDMMLDLSATSTKYLANYLFEIDLVQNFKQSLFKDSIVKDIDIERESAFRDIAHNIVLHAQAHFFSITLPTGLGKTFAAYHAAILLQNSIHQSTGKVSRIIYCLPFTSVIDQNAAIFEKIALLGNVPDGYVAKHHYLANYPDAWDKYELTDSEAEYLTEGWEHPFIITTFVQLLETIFSDRNRVLRKFHNMAGSIIILDEVQNIPAKYHRAVDFIFSEMAEYLNVKFIFVTATQPYLVNTKPVLELTDPTQVKTRYYFENRNRINLDLSWLKKYSFKEQEFDVWYQHIKEFIEAHPDSSVLIITNTIKWSQQLYEKLKCDFGQRKRFYLSGSIIPYDRAPRIAEIQISLRNNEAPLLVSTQVVEAGVDIDFDYVWRDFAPLDSINQSAGRCNRNGIKQTGSVIVFNSGKAKQVYDTVLTDITKGIFMKMGDVVPEKAFYEMNQEYFREISNRISDKSDISSELIKHIKKMEVRTLASKFQLIPYRPDEVNIFMPINDEAAQIWQKYTATFAIEERFERKKAMKKIQPMLTKFITKIAKSQYNVSGDIKPLYYEPNWELYYDREMGVMKNNPESKTVFI